MHHKSFVHALIKTHLPAELVRQMDWTTFELHHVDGRHVRSNLWRETQADVLCCVQLAKDTAFFYINVEHQSKDDPWIALRLLNYRNNFLADYHQSHPEKKLPLFISALYYHGKSSPFPHSLNWFDLFESPNLAKHYMSKPILIDIRACHQFVFWLQMRPMGRINRSFLLNS